MTAEVTDTAGTVTQADTPGTVRSLRDRQLSGFTEDERKEIILRLQVVENVCAGLSSQVSTLITELFPPSDNDEPVNMVREIHGFCIRLSQVLDAMAGNPMFAAMLPPDAVQ